MLITKLHTICLMTLSVILFLSPGPFARDSRMVATAAGCEDASCLPYGIRQSDAAAHLERINIFSADGKDPRQQLDRGSEEAVPFLPAGYATNNREIIDLEGVRGITESNAFLVSPCYALADFHGVFGRQMTHDPEASYSMTIWLGAGALQNDFRYAFSMKPIRVGKDAGHGHNGLVLMQLERCAGSAVGWMSLDIPGADTLVDAKVGMVAYHHDRSKKNLWVQQHCTIQAYSQMSGMLKHDCASLPGSTGGMIFRNMNGVPTVIATNWGSSSSKSGILKSYSNEDSNLAVPLDMLKENSEMLKIIQDDIRRFGKPNPALRKTASPRPAVDSKQSTS